MPFPPIEMEDVARRFAARWVLRGATLSVSEGEVVGLLGSNGSGKSTLLRILATLLRPDRGAARVGGADVVREADEARHRLGYLAHAPGLYEDLSARENLSFAVGMMDGDPGAVDAVLERVGLTGVADLIVRGFSAGMQRRLAMARLLLRSPSVLLLDEPLAALDQQLRQQMQVELKSIQAQVGITFVCVTHHQEEALALSDRLAVMHQGQVVQVGRPQDLYESPATHFVAQFIGTSNELRGTLRDPHVGQAILTCDHPGLSGKVRVAMPSDLQSGAAVALILRPERVRLASNGEGTAFDNAVPGTVEALRYLGSGWRCVVRITEQIAWTIHLPNHANGLVPWKVGDPVSVQWNVSDGTVLPLP